ncbi:MAG: hypothetical protein KKA42_06995, partial [candidate division Zixibacteria bacterium]|nr:hypothetical protein [candidate division Zixibacteria bacterium]
MQTDLIKTIIYFLTGGFLVFQAITVTRDNFSNRVNRTAGAMLLFAGLGPLSLALGYLIFDTPGATPSVAVDGTTMYNLYHVWEFFFPALLVFSWVFPIDRLRTIRLPYLRYIIVIPQLLHVLLALFHKQMLVALNAIVESGGGEGFTALVLRPVAWLSSQLIQFVGLVYQNEQVIFGAINILYILVAVYFLESGRRYLTNPRLLSQARIVIWGTRLGMGLFIVSFLCTTLSASELVQSAGSYLLLAAILTGSGCFAYAIIRHQFLGVQLVFRQSLIYTITSALLVGTYVVVGMSSEQFLEPLFGSRAEAVSYVFILFILLLFQPISSWIDNVITSMFVRTRTDHRNIIERFSRQIISMFDPLQLRQSIEEMLKTALLVERVYFVLYDDSVKEYAILRSDDYPRRTVIAREDL